MINAYVLSFNCARHYVNPEVLAPSLFDALPQAATVPDVLVVSLQEVAPIAYSFLGGSYLKPYFDRISTTVYLAADLHSHGSERLEHVATRSLGMTALMIFAKPQFKEKIQYIQAAGAGVGVWNMGNKGAVAMRLGVSCSGSDEVLELSFVAAHLAPHEKAYVERNKVSDLCCRADIRFTARAINPQLSTPRSPPCGPQASLFSIVLTHILTIH